MTSQPGDDMPHSEPTPWGIALGFAIVYFSWGTTYYATSLAMKDEEMPPGLFFGGRLVVAGTILLVWQLWRGNTIRLSLGDYARLFGVSLFLFLGSNFLIGYGQKHVPSGVAAILIATTPLWMGLFGIAWPGGERLSWRGWLGLSIGFAGTVVTKFQDPETLLTDVHALLILGSAASWAIGSLISRHMALKITHFTSAGYQMIFGGLSQLVIGTLVGEWDAMPSEISPRAIGLFFYLMVFGSLLGFVAFNWLLGHVPAAKVGTYAYVNPIIAVFVGWCASETVVDRYLLAGVAVIFVGVYLVRADRMPSKEIELEPD